MRLLILGTAKSLIHKFEKIKAFAKEPDTKVLAWSHAYVYCIKQRFYPDYWSYIDPHSSIDAFKFMKKKNCKMPSKLYLFSPALTGKRKDFAQYIGTAQNLTGKVYNKNYTALLNEIREKEYINFEEISLDTTKNNKEYGEKWLYYDKHPEGKLVFNHKYCEDKLLFCVLPLVHYLGYKDIVHAGFDGQGPRYMANSAVQHNINNIQRLRKDLMPRWKQFFEKRDMTFTKLRND